MEDYLNKYLLYLIIHPEQRPWMFNANLNIYNSIRESL